MNELVLRFTLSNAIEGSLVISEPDGWADAKLKLERDKEYHSIVEFYEQPLTFYGAPDAKYNGGYEYLLNILETQGPDADVSFLVEISDDQGDTYETLFTGLIDVSSWTETDFYIASCGVVRDDFWSRFYNHRETSIDVQSTTDIYGDAREVLSSITEDLSGQVVQQQYRGLGDESATIEYILGASQYGQIDFPRAELDEIKERYSLPRSVNASRPSPIFAVKYGGDYTFSSYIFLYQGPFIGSSAVDPGVEIRLQINDDTPVTFTKTDQSSGLDSWSRYSLSTSVTLVEGDLIRVYIINTTGGSETVNWYSNLIHESFFDITAETVFPASTAESMLTHELTQSVLDRIIGQDDSFYSEYFGNTETQRADYAEDGCFSYSSVKMGLHTKGYTFTEKPLTISFNKIWDGLNPMFNLGLGYETAPNSPERQVIRIEPKSHFYNNTTILNLDWVNNIEHTIDAEKIFKLVKIGYKKWQSENISGLDEVQTKHEYVVPLKKIGTEITIESDFIAAGLAQENTRRQSVEKSKDYKLDEDYFFTHLEKDGSSYVPALYSGIGIVGANVRYNLMLSPARNMYRWLDFLSGGVQFNSDFNFQKGEGNFDAQTFGPFGDDSCHIFNVIENLEIPITNDFLFGIDVYSFEHPLTWAQYKTLRDNPKNAIGISTTDSDHEAFFLVSLEWSPVEPKGNFVVIKAPVATPPVSDCPTFDSTLVTFDQTDITWDCD